MLFAKRRRRALVQRAIADLNLAFALAAVVLRTVRAADDSARPSCSVDVLRRLELVEKKVDALPPAIAPGERSGSLIDEKWFPIQGETIGRTRRASGRVPWGVAAKAYESYARRYGASQSLERLAERGGFGWSELAWLLAGAPECAGLAANFAPPAETT